MRTVHASATVAATVHDAITAWCATDRWPNWVEGLDAIDGVTPEWPGPGAIVRWHSNPAGRGAVTERILAYEPLARIESEIEDDQTVARQVVTFTPIGDGTEVAVDLGYRITRRSPLTPLVDGLFVRPAMRASLQKTLSRFAAEFG